MILVVRPKVHSQLGAAIEVALERHTPRRGMRELTYDSYMTLSRFKYELREAYLDVEGVIFVEGTADMLPDPGRLPAVTAFCNQQQIPLVLLSQTSLTAKDPLSAALRTLADQIELTTHRYFIVGIAPIETHAGKLAAELAKLFDTGWYGRYHAESKTGEVELVEMGRRHA